MKGLILGGVWRASIFFPSAVLALSPMGRVRAQAIAATYSWKTAVWAMWSMSRLSSMRDLLPWGLVLHIWLKGRPVASPWCASMLRRMWNPNPQLALALVQNGKLVVRAAASPSEAEDCSRRTVMLTGASGIAAGLLLLLPVHSAEARTVNPGVRRKLREELDKLKEEAIQSVEGTKAKVQEVANKAQVTISNNVAGKWIFISVQNCVQLWLREFRVHVRYEKINVDFDWWVLHSFCCHHWVMCFPHFVATKWWLWISICQLYNW